MNICRESITVEHSWSGGLRQARLSAHAPQHCTTIHHTSKQANKNILLRCASLSSPVPASFTGTTPPPASGALSPLFTHHFNRRPTCEILEIISGTSDCPSYEKRWGCAPCQQALWRSSVRVGIFFPINKNAHDLLKSAFYFDAAQLTSERCHGRDEKRKKGRKGGRKDGWKEKRNG